ncbi:MAG: hypothetical protein AAF441_09745 [Pseudomonadota bacterium]
MKIACIAVLLLAARTDVALASEQIGQLDTSRLPEPGSVDEASGLDAWTRIHEVLRHPRCVNCHTGADNRPVWSGPSFGKRRKHGMSINAGESRIGAEGLSCRTCHQTSRAPNTVPHAAPHAGIDWQLAPVEFQWIDKTSAEICRQLRNPDVNGGRDGAGLVEHILDDLEVTGFITWSFDPGPGREPAPGGLQTHLEDMALWAAAGMPCPHEG